MRLTGPVTIAAVIEFNLQVVREYPHAIGWVYDYRRALLVASDVDLTNLSQTRHPDPDRRPAAFVVTPEIEPAIRRQAVRMARRGFDRRVFFDQDEAHDWVLWMAAKG